MTWRIIDSQKLKQELMQVCTRARSEGRLSTVLGAMKSIYSDLERDPFALGEPHNRLKHMELLLCVVTRKKLVVRYAIDEKRRWVYLRSISLLP